MLSVAGTKVNIESLEYRLAQNLYPMGERQPIEADDYPMKPMVTDITDVLQIVTDVNPMLAEDSSVTNPQKVAKIDENIRKMQKIWVDNTGFAYELHGSSVLLVKLVVIGAID